MPNNLFGFEIVPLHELGHGYQLGHVINLNEIMHFSLSSGTSSLMLSLDDITSAVGIQNRSTGTSLCNQFLMKDSTICILNVDENDLNNSIILNPNPAREQIFIKNESFVNLEKVIIYDVRGREALKYDLSNSSGTVAINLVGASKGIYFVHLYSEGTFITKKIILE